MTPCHQRILVTGEGIINTMGKTRAVFGFLKQAGHDIQTTTFTPIKTFPDHYLLFIDPYIRLDYHPGQLQAKPSKP